MPHPTFTVIDPKTGEPADVSAITEEIWGRLLVNPQGFYLTEKDGLVVFDENGDYEFCPLGRFEVRFS